MSGDETNVNPFRTAVSYRGQTSEFLSSLSPKPDCGPKRVNLSKRENKTRALTVAVRVLVCRAECFASTNRNRLLSPQGNVWEVFSVDQWVTGGLSPDPDI